MHAQTHAHACACMHMRMRAHIVSQTDFTRHIHTHPHVHTRMQAVPIKQRAALECVGAIEEAMVKGFPFEVPAEYASRPLLKGRATLEMRVDFKETPQGPQVG